jgi:two-component system, NtrC family, nitrogen regulation sensor histidine kinase NtrY
MTTESKQEKINSLLSSQDRKRRKREFIFVAAILIVVAILTFVVNHVVRFGSDFPISNTILMFVLINVNLLLLLLLIFLVFRNLVKLLYDRKNKVIGSKLRTRLVVSFITLTLLPTTVLFFFSIHFITKSIQFWFNAPIEQALENSLKVGRLVYSHLEENNRFFLERITYQIKTKNLLAPEKAEDLNNYIQVVQRAFNLHAVEIYAINSNRLAFCIDKAFENQIPEKVTSNNLQKVPASGGIRSISEDFNGGELFRTIGTVPFKAKGMQAEAFVVLSVLIPPELFQDMQSISDGFQEYQQIKLLKEPIKLTYYVALSIVALLVVFCAIWLGLYLAKTISIPIMQLSEATLRIAEGNLDVEIDVVADDEIGSLVDAFNRMTRDLRTGREQLELSAKMLRERSIEIEKRRKYMEIVLKNVSTGVITLDADGNISSINKSSERMLLLNPEKLIHKSFKRLLKGQDIKLATQIIDDLRMSRNNVAEVSLRVVVNGKPKSFLVNINALSDDMGQQIGYVIVFDDLTELEKAQRMAAWREVARRIAHEVKNPLTPITLSAQWLRRKYADHLESPVFNECTQTIIEQVSHIRNLVNEFSMFAKFPTANLKPTELIPIIKDSLALYREGYRNIEFLLENKDNIPLLNLDVQQIKQAMINLLDNAIAAIKESGHIWVTVTHDPILKRVRIEVADDGIGISDLNKTRLFEPDFSTKKAGMGLGLTIVSSIIADHNGVISVQNNKPSGAKFVIELPV